MKKSFALIGIGVFNLLHASSHLLQFIQSLLMVSTTVVHNHKDESWIEKIIHNPILNILWVIIGVFTLYIGIKDFKHHNNCKK